MKKNRSLRSVLATAILLLAQWPVITIWVEGRGPARTWTIGEATSRRAIVIYDPDPFFNFDERVSRSFAKALTEKDISVKISTVAAVDSNPEPGYDLYAYCANTYNSRPDWSVTRYINEHTESIRNKSVVAITLGAGITNSSKKNFEKCIINNGGNLLGSYSLWLLRPKDKSISKRSNIKTAEELAHEWADEIASELNKQLIKH